MKALVLLAFFLGAAAIYLIVGQIPAVSYCLSAGCADLSLPALLLIFRFILPLGMLVPLGVFLGSRGGAPSPATLGFGFVCLLAWIALGVDAIVAQPSHPEIRVIQ